MKRSSRHVLLVALLTLVPTTSVWAQAERVPITFDKPGDREFVVDKANLLTSAQKQRIATIADGVLTQTSRPLLVVTIDSMAAHGGSGLTIEMFARYLFGQLGLGRNDGRDGNRGILLLVSRQDRKARIELGADWPVSADRKAEQIMSRAIIPRFRRQDFGGGVVAGAEALAKLAQSSKSKPAEAPGAEPVGSGHGHNYADVDQHYVSYSNEPSGSGGGFCCFLLPLLFILPLLGRGGGLFSILSLLLFGMASNLHTGRSRRDDDDDSGGWMSGGGGSGGGFSGGSFGGGFSGGGEHQDRGKKSDASVRTIFRRRTPTRDRCCCGCGSEDGR